MPNIYTKALNFGADRLENGHPITYNQLVQHLTQNGQHPELLDPNFRKLFIVWYFQHFYSFELKEEMQYFPYTSRLPLYIDWASNGTNLDLPSYLMTDSYSQYVQYTQLEEYRKESKNAMKVAIVSIILTATFALASIIISLFFDT